MKYRDHLRLCEPVAHFFGNDFIVRILHALRGNNRCSCNFGVSFGALFGDRGQSVDGFGDGVKKCPIVVGRSWSLNVDLAAKALELD